MHGRLKRKPHRFSLFSLFVNFHFIFSCIILLISIPLFLSRKSFLRLPHRELLSDTAARCHFYSCFCMMAGILYFRLPQSMACLSFHLIIRNDFLNMFRQPANQSGPLPPSWPLPPFSFRTIPALTQTVQGY